MTCLLFFFPPAFRFINVYYRVMLECLGVMLKYYRLMISLSPSRQLNVDAMREAGAVFQGTHDFSTFRALSSDAPFKSPVKTMGLVQVQPGLSFSQRHFHRYTSPQSRVRGILGNFGWRPNGGMVNVLRTAATLSKFFRLEKCVWFIRRVARELSS